MIVLLHPFAKMERAMTDFNQLRQRMIDYQLLARGLRDQTVLDAINAIPREEFVPTELVEFAYSDTPLPIAASQTISQPYIVALVTAALELKPTDRVLEVGTGSGYTAAILAEIAMQDECRIDSISQSWATLSKCAPESRAKQSLESALEFLVNGDERIISLLTPPFDTAEHDPGYFKGYPPGVRENGGRTMAETEG